MRGRERTRPNRPLSEIFFHLRAARDARDRRSWQRRARAALAKIDTLTDAERHEVISVWSRPDCFLFDSPALRKVTGQPERLPHQTKPARAVMRAAFTATGQKKSRDNARPDFRPTAAANDSFFDRPDEATP